MWSAGDGGVLQAVAAAEASEAARVQAMQMPAKSGGDSKRDISEAFGPSGADVSSSAAGAASGQAMVAAATGTAVAAKRERISIGARVTMPLMVACL